MICPFCQNLLNENDISKSILTCNCKNNTYVVTDFDKNIEFWDSYVYINNNKLIFESSKVENYTELRENRLAINPLIRINEYTCLNNKYIYDLIDKLYALSLY